MQKRHTDRESYFDEQSQTSKNYYIPYIKEVIGHIPDKVLEVGCGEGGNLLPFAKAGCRVMGVDIDAMRIEQPGPSSPKGISRDSSLPPTFSSLRTRLRIFP